MADSEDSDCWGDWSPRGKHRRKRGRDDDIILEARLPPSPHPMSPLDVAEAFLEETRVYAQLTANSATVFSDRAVQGLARATAQRLERASDWVRRLRAEAPRAAPSSPPWTCPLYTSVAAYESAAFDICLSRLLLHKHIYPSNNIRINIIQT